MCCGSESHHGGPWAHHAGSCGCGCGGSFRSGLCFSTKEEKIEWLEQSLESMQAAAKSVEERIAKLKKEK
ncbi:MAG: hypothetical protein E3J64_07750 [Anaerolineales bacterium]|nr:MAG: hypothetical protein E3J64_07750 [Anaerolineales bacterium]